MNLVSTPKLALQLGDWKGSRLVYSNQVLAVSSFQEASDKWNALRDRQGWGASESPICRVIDVTTGKPIAKVSYNGRVWDTEGKEIL